MKKLVLLIKYWILKLFYGFQLKPCPDCGQQPIIEVLHNSLSIHCKKGCHGVSISDFNGNRLAWTEVVWQWNHMADAYRKHGSQQTLDKVKNSNDNDTSYGFGKYFIEHPTSEVKNDEGNNC